MRIILVGLTSLGLFTLCSCATGPTPEQVAEAGRFDQKIKANLKFTDAEVANAKRMNGIPPSAVEETMRETCRDPESTKIRNLRRLGFGVFDRKAYSAETWKVLDNPNNSESLHSMCGWLWTAEMNGKNGYGAYTGYQNVVFIDMTGVKRSTNGTPLFQLVPKGRCFNVSHLLDGTFFSQRIIP